MQDQQFTRLIVLNKDRPQSNATSICSNQPLVQSSINMESIRVCFARRIKFLDNQHIRRRSHMEKNIDNTRTTLKPLQTSIQKLRLTSTLNLFVQRMGMNNIR